MELQDHAGAGHDALMAARNQLLALAAENPELTRVRHNGLDDSPQLQIDTVEAINRVEQHFSREALAVDRTDGISMTFADWRFNLRSSNTEPVVRLNVESRGDVPLMEARTRTLLTLLNE